MIAVQLGGKAVVALGFAPAGDALFAAAGRVVFRLAWPGGRVTRTSYHVPRGSRPGWCGRLTPAADGRAVAVAHAGGAVRWEAADGGRLMPTPLPAGLGGGLPVQGADPPLAAVRTHDGRPREHLPWRTRLVAAGGAVRADIPFRQWVTDAWQEPDGRLLVRDAGGLVRYRPDTGRPSLWARAKSVLGYDTRPRRPRFRAERAFPAPPAGFKGSARVPGTDTLLVGDRDEVRQWDFAAGAERRRWRLPLHTIHSLAASPDGLTAAAGGGRGRVVAFDLD